MGYNERDHIRGDDSWKSFHEVMCLAKEKDVDMVLLAGDLFHENKPSRKSMYQVMRSLRMNCYGEKPCELEMLSDGSENFQGYQHVSSGGESTKLTYAGLSTMSTMKIRTLMSLYQFSLYMATMTTHQGCVGKISALRFSKLTYARKAI